MIWGVFIIIIITIIISVYGMCYVIYDFVLSIIKLNEIFVDYTM